MNKNFENFRKEMNEGTILTDKVKMVYRDKGFDTDILVMDLGGIRGIIKREDIDNEVEWKSLVSFIGRTVHFVVTEVLEGENTVVCSRKIAQEKMAPAVIERLKTGEPVDAVISGVILYGAFMDIDGVYAILKNNDFSDDHVPVRDIHKVGETLRVRMKKVSENDRLEVEIVDRYVLKSVIRIESFEKNQIILGKVNGVKPWGAYVSIAPGLDALCDIPEVGEIEAGVEVSIRITQVRPEERRVRGKILRIIQ